MPEMQLKLSFGATIGKLADRGKSRNIPFSQSLAPTQARVSSSSLLEGSPPRSAPQAFSELAQRIARGSAVVFFLTPETLLDGPFTGQPTPLRWAPLSSKVLPQLAHTPDAYFRADPWAKEHPVFRRTLIRRHS